VIDWRRLGRGLVLPILFLALWELLRAAGVLPYETLSQPSLIARATLSALADGTLLYATWQTLEAATLGWAIAGAVAVLAGVLLGLFPPLARMTSLSVEALRPIPSVALIPLSLLVFGFGLRMEVAVVVFAVFWPVLIVTSSGVRGIEPNLLEVGRALKLSVARRIWKLVLPAALPSIAVGLRLGAGIAIVVAVTVEIATNPWGLGYGMINASQSLRADLMFAQLLWIGVVGWGLNVALLRIERRWLAWFWSAREAAR